MSKLYKNQEQMAIGDGLTIYLREKYPNASLKHFGSPQTIRWNECDMEEQDLTPYYQNQWYYTKQAWENLNSREREYPPIQDQLDMIYWDKINGTNKWEQTITKIKKETPKSPEFVEPETIKEFQQEEHVTFNGEEFSRPVPQEALNLLNDMIDKHF
tara:strand:+ start:495 stop:965 length:471 start_codon:yes stop_codon:yes gene_type:complete